jgi:hypothetical protein
MAALTSDRNTAAREGNQLSLPVAAGTKIFAGSIVARDASGNAVPGSTATTLLGVGRAEQQVDNTGGAAGDKAVNIAKGIFQFANSSAGDLITLADVGANCHIVDDQTVAKTNGTNTRSVAGAVFDVDANGVWVKFN